MKGFIDKTLLVLIYSKHREGECPPLPFSNYNLIQLEERRNLI